MSDIIALILAVCAAIAAYPSVRKGLMAIKQDIEALIHEIRRRRER